MSRCGRLLVLATAVLAGLGGDKPPAKPGRPPAGARPVRRDWHGHLLPPDASARLGGASLRHPDEVRAATFSPDGTRLATASRHALHVWDLATGKEVRRIDDRNEDIESLAFAPDGKTLYSNGYTFHRWDVRTGKDLGPFRPGDTHTKAIALSPDGKVVAALMSSGGIGLWDARTGKEVRRWAGVGQAVTFSPDGRVLAVNHGRLWDTATGKPRAGMHRPAQPDIHAVAFSPDGKWLAAAGGAGQRTATVISLWDLATGKRVRQFRGHQGGISCVAFSPDGKTLASAGMDYNGKVLDAAGMDSTVRLWQVATGKEVRQLPRLRGGLCGVAFAPDGKTLAHWSDGDSRAFLWDVATGKQRFRPEGHGDVIRCIRYSPDGAALATSSDDHTVRLWEAATGKPLRTFRISPRNPKAEPPKVGVRGVAGIAFAPDGKTLAADEQDTICLWDLATGKEVRRIRRRRGERFALTACLAFAPDGKLLASGDPDQIVRLWDPATGKEVRRFPSHAYGLSCLAFSPDGKTLATGGMDNTVLLWEVATGKKLHTLPQGPGAIWVVGVQALAFAPDGKTVVAAGSGAWVRGKLRAMLNFWDTTTGRRRRQVPGHYGWIYGVAFAPDGKTLTSVGDGAVRLWEVATGQECGHFGGGEGMLSVAWSPTGAAVASGHYNGTGLVWDVAGHFRMGRDSSVPFTPRELDDLWEQLARRDAPRAYRAVYVLTTRPEQAVALLRERLRAAATSADTKRITRLVAELDSDSFVTREKAMRELEKEGRDAEWALRAKRENRPSPEARRRVEELLRKLEATGGPALSPDQLRAVRAVQALEMLGTAKARAVLGVVAKGARRTVGTAEAAAALERLRKRPVAKR